MKKPGLFAFPVIGIFPKQNVSCCKKKLKRLFITPMKTDTDFLSVAVPVGWIHLQRWKLYD